MERKREDVKVKQINEITKKLLLREKLAHSFEKEEKKPHAKFAHLKIYKSLHCTMCTVHTVHIQIGL
jgi:hypothetical protein